MKMQHLKVGIYWCKICNKIFDKRKIFRIHQRKHHWNESMIVFCEVCGKECKTMRFLKLHKVVHNDEKLFKCDICGASFKLELTLSTHLRIHNHDDKYLCRGCNTSFNMKPMYYEHLNTCLAHQNNVEEGIASENISPS